MAKKKKDPIIESGIRRAIDELWSGLAPVDSPRLGKEETAARWAKTATPPSVERAVAILETSWRMTLLRDGGPLGV